MSCGNPLSLNQQANWHAAVIKALPRGISPLDALAWEKSGEKLTEVLEGVLCPPAVLTTVRPPALVLRGATALGAVAAKKTRDCFIGGVWDCGYPVERYLPADRRLPAEQPAGEACLATAYWIERGGLKFAEIAATALRLGSNLSLDFLQKVLRSRGMTFTLQQVEQLVERQEGGGDTGLSIGFASNIAFVEDSGVNGVSVLRFGRENYSNSDNKWWGDVVSFGGSCPNAKGLLLRNVAALAM